MSVYEKAIDMFKQQHDRWNHWALFFFGLIASAFLIQHNAQQMPFWIAPFSACIVSVFWVFVALNIRAETKCWQSIVKRLEALSISERDNFKLFEEYDAELKSWGRWGDFKKTLKLWTVESNGSVSRLITLLGPLMTVGFLTFFLYSILK